MGFFQSSSKTSAQNPILEQFTMPIRGISPWVFASIDPAATLASMGATTKIGLPQGIGVTPGLGQDLGPEFKKELQEKVAFENAQLDAEKDALSRIVERQKSGKFITPQESEFINQSLDKAFEYTQNIGMKNLQVFADTLAGRRGLRTSDTPVARPAMEAARELQMGIGSERARLGLQTTLQFSQQQQAFDESFRQSLAGLRMGAWESRMNAMFQGMQGVSNVSSFGRTTSTPSIAQNISQGMSLASQAIKLGGQFASFGTGKPPTKGEYGPEGEAAGFVK